MYFKQLLYLSIIFILLAGFTYSVHILSTGAPASSTGAPGELGCNATGCHDDYLLNSGNAMVSFLFDGGASKFIPGETYDISISIQENGINRFGFELLALNDLDETNAGVFVITDSVRTQKISGLNGLTDRKYLTYTYNGTIPNYPNKSNWNVRWEAPSLDNGSVTFYFGLLSANNDGTDNGDYTYLNSYTIAPEPSSLSEIIEQQKIKVFPNPVTNRCSISYNLENDDKVNISVFDCDGRFIKTICNGKQTKGFKEFAWDRSDVETGIYMIVLKFNNQNHIKRILVSND